MREIIAFPTCVTDQYHRSSPPRHAILPVVADSALDAVALIAAAYLVACHDTNSPPFRLNASARESLTMTLDPDDNGRVLAIQDSVPTGFLWIDGFGTLIGPGDTHDHPAD